MSDATDLQRAFLAWLNEAGLRLAVAIHIQSSTVTITKFFFEMANLVLTGTLTGCPLYSRR